MRNDVRQSIKRAPRDAQGGLDAEVAEHVARLEEPCGKRFGDAHDRLIDKEFDGA